MTDDERAREVSQRIWDLWSQPDVRTRGLWPYVEQAVTEALAAERERCAKANPYKRGMDGYSEEWWGGFTAGVEAMRAAIRAPGDSDD